MEVYKRKAEMLTAAKDAELCLDYLDKNGYHKFTYFNNHKEFFKQIKLFKTNGYYYIFEIMRNGYPRKPHLDLELYYADEKTCKKFKKSIIKKLKIDIIKVFDNEYQEEIRKDDILILDSSGVSKDKYKLSLHVIISPENRTLYYTDHKFTDSSAFHLYSALINLDPLYKESLDGQVYRSGATLRIIGSAKNLSDNRTLEPLEDKPEIEYMLTYVKSNSKKLTTPIIEQTVHDKRIVIRDNPTKTNISKRLEELVKKYHPSAKYYGFYKNTYYGFNYENRNEKCPISGKKHESNGFFVVENDRGFYLKCHSKYCKARMGKGSIHIGYNNPADDFIDSANQIDQQYLITEGEINKKPKELVKDLIIEWLDTEIKTMAIKSSMGTGKTTAVKRILDYDTSLKKILWITHRQTLTKQIYGSFKSFGFKSYMDVDGSLFDHDRVIVQVDSLTRLQKYDAENVIFKQYDLVIIDEIEGNLNHYNSPFLNKSDRTSRSLFKFMTDCIDSAKKLLVMDADIGMRTKLFIDNFGKYIFINNNYRPQQKKYIVTNNRIKFDKRMIDDIENTKNICIVSMSATALEHIKIDLEKLEIKYVMHTSKTDDKLKNELEDVNNFWNQYQVVLYSPTIESGVDFNKDHFDKIYCILKNGQMTCSQRGFLQMVGRIRQIKDPNILCYYDGPIKMNELMYTYDDVLSYFRYYEELNGKKILEEIEHKKEVINGEVRITRVKKDVSLFDHISIYNEVEQLNKHKDIFMTVLSSLIQRAGHKIRYEIAEPKRIEREEIDTQIEDINENNYDIEKLLKKQSKNKLDETEKLVLKKIFFKRTFGIKYTKNKKMFKEFYDKYKDKEIHLRRYEKLFGYKDTYKGHDIDNFNDGKDKSRHKIIMDLVDRLMGQNQKFYDSNELVDIEIDNDQYIKAMEDISKNSIYFKNEEKNRALFFKKKGKIKPMDEKNKQFYANMVQSILGSYCIDLNRDKRSRKNKKRGFKYSLSVDKQIKNIVEYKHGEISKVDNYQELFKKSK